MGRERSVIAEFATNPTMPARGALAEGALSILAHLRPLIGDWRPRAQGCNLLEEPRLEVTRYLDFAANRDVAFWAPV